MTPVDEAREALLRLMPYAETHDLLEALIAAVRAEERREAIRSEAAKVADLTEKYEAKLLALRQDERLGDALHSAVHPGHPWSGCREPDWVYKHLIPRFRAALDATEAERVPGDWKPCTDPACPSAQVAHEHDARGWYRGPEARPFA